MSNEKPDIEAIEKRLKVISPNPWGVGHNWEQQDPGLFIFEKQSPGFGTIITAGDHEPLSKEDAEFIAHAPTDIAALLAEVERLTDELNECTAYLAESQSAVAQYLLCSIAEVFDNENLYEKIDRLTKENERLKNKDGWIDTC
ncbi:unnamed protein product [marine sediment metagenome]|uniref:Ead/Ea22-like family protein n=1 Tax=marine sediment metagenome TaxID=412755 RepID=X0XUR2_9ZZZZ